MSITSEENQEATISITRSELKAIVKQEIECAFATIGLSVGQLFKCSSDMRVRHAKEQYELTVQTEKTLLSLLQNKCCDSDKITFNQVSE
jgi:hypothetical protein